MRSMEKLRSFAALIGVAALASFTPAAAMPPPLPDVAGKDAATVQADMQQGRISSEVLVASYLERIRTLDDAGPQLNAVIASVSQLPAVAGYPHLTVPMGAIDGLPVGLSFIGAQWSDAAVLSAGYAYEQASKARLRPTCRTGVAP